MRVEVEITVAIQRPGHEDSYIREIKADHIKGGEGENWAIRGLIAEVKDRVFDRFSVIEEE